MKFTNNYATVLSKADDGSGHKYYNVKIRPLVDLAGGKDYQIGDHVPNKVSGAYGKVTGKVHSFFHDNPTKAVTGIGRVLSGSHNFDEPIVRPNGTVDLVGKHRGTGESILIRGMKSSK